jgi:UDP-N-acetylglucosamine--N-acetylmuramyl-(pentapeptide) pyrophosphoryl-undecaprenol N-acetylglucosamine transferase
VPVIIFAWFLRINTLIHEQNVIPGRANMFLAMLADRIAISFPKTRDYFRRYGKKIAYTGNPIRPELTLKDKLEALNFFGFSNDKFTILVMGGSQGSHRINVEFQKAISGISRELGFQIIHLSGSRDYSFLKPRYNGLNTQVRLFDFLKPMHYAYSAADLVISRAGATTISEIIFFALPAILIPYPYARAHQFANARILEENGCAVIMAEEELSTGRLKSGIEYFMSHPDKMKNMRLAYRDFIIPDSSQELGREIIALAS